MADIISTVGNGHANPDYATLALWNAGEGGVDPNAGSTSIAECSGYLGVATNINGTFVRGAIIRGDVTFDGTNALSLANTERLTISAGSGINVEDLRIFTNNQFISALNYNADSIVMDRVVFDNNTSGLNAIDINGTFTNGHIRNFVARGGADAVMAGFNQGTNLTNGLVYGAVDKGVEGSSSAPMVLTDIFAFNNGGQDVDSVGGFTLVNVATEDGTGTHTGYTSAELVDFASGDLRTRSTSDLATLGTPFIGAFLEALAPTGDYDAVINGSLPFISGSLNLSQTPSEIDAIIDGNIPFISSSLESTQTLPEYNTSVSGDIPFIGSSITVTQTVPEYDSSINGSLPFLTSDLTLTRAAPEEINVTVLGDLPFIGSSATATQTVPEYNSTISGSIPFIGSNLNLTQAGLAEFNAVVLGAMPFLSSSLTTTQSIPEYDTSISGDLPFLSSTLVLTQIVSGVSASIDGNIPFLSSSLSVSHEIPDYDVTISGNIPFITSSLVLTQQDNNNNAEISGVLPFIGSSLDLSNQIPPPNDLSISGNMPFIAGNLFLVNREIEPVLTASAARLTDTYNITYQTLTYTVINEV